MGYGFYQLWGAKRDKRCLARIWLFSTASLSNAENYSLFCHGMHACRFQADEIMAVRNIVHPVLQAEWDLR